MKIRKNLLSWGKLATSKSGSFLNDLLLNRDTSMLILGGITGVVCGLGAVIFHHTIDLIFDLFFIEPAHYLQLDSFLEGKNWYIIAIVILIPAIGGLAVGLLSKYFEKGPKGEGIPNVIQSVSSKGGVIQGNVAVLKTVQSALSIGTGGAGGKEGPIVQIGAAIGSFIGQFLSLSPDRLKILVGCGAAAGLSAAFNTPLGGALFSMEIIMRTFNARSFSPIIIASVFGTVISRMFIGNEPAFRIPKYELASNVEFLFYIILGFLAAFAAVYFVRVFMKIEGMFEKHTKKIPEYYVPAIGGLFVGVIGVFLPGIYGFSYQLIDSSLYNIAPMWMLILLLIFKPIATGLTIGSGGSGGTFAPSAFTGAMLGGAFGQLLAILFPEYNIFPGAYALVGMAALIAGTTHASLTALIMVFEMTNNYRIILPLMLTITIAFIISKRMLHGSLYTLKFDIEGQGIDIYGRKVSILKNMPLAELIEPFRDFVNITNSYRDVLSKMQNSRFDTLLVKDTSGKISGQITFQQIRHSALDDETKAILPFLVAGDLMEGRLPNIEKHSNAETALKLMEANDVEFLPVFDQKTFDFAGVVSRHRILSHYQNELLLTETDSDLSLK